MNNDIGEVIRAAQRGDEDAVMQLLRLLRPMLKRYGTVNASLDEDLTQFLIVRFLLATKDFKL